MLLRSSSTPILGSLLPSSSSPNPNFSDSPNHHRCIENKTPFLHGPHPDPPPPLIRRARSDGNLHSLPKPSPNPNHVLDTIPSFSIFNRIGDEDDEVNAEEGLDTLGENCGFSFGGNDQNLKSVGSYGDLPLFLARGLGIDRIGSGLFDGDNGVGGEKSEIEKYYKRMVDEDPENALYLSNYAQFLYQTKGDSKRAEEYYSRAILAEPGDGEILSRYAKLVWELHNDKERASSYFEQAVRATPNDSNVLAAHASFLWETEDDDDQIGDDGQLQDYFGAPVHQGILTSAGN